MLNLFAKWKRSFESASLRSRVLFKYTFSIVVVFAALLLHFVLVYAVGKLPPFLIFYPAIMIVAILVGLWPGILATLLAAAILDFYILPPKGHIFVFEKADAVSLTIFGLMGLFICILAEAYHRSKLKVQESKALRESEERFRSAFERGAIPMALTSLENKLLKVNPAFCKMIGYTEAELTRLRFTDITHPDDLPVNLAGIKAVTSGQRDTFRMEKRYFHKNGSILWVDMSTASVRDELGKPLYIVTYVQDITDRKQAEESLRQSESMLAKAQEIAHVGSWELDFRNNKLIWSDEVYRIFGLKPQEFGATYEAFLDRTHPDDRTSVDQAYSGSVQEGRDTYEIEHRVIRKGTGEIRWVYEKCYHMRDSSGRIIRSIGMVMDITERKQADEAIRESEGKFRSLFEHSPDAVFLTLPEGRILQANPAACKMYGMTEEEICRAGRNGLIDVEDSAMQAALEERKLRGRVTNIVLTAIRKNGERFPVEMSSVIIGGENLRAFVIMRDITKRKQAEESLVQTQERLRNQTNELESIIGIVSHDLRAPLVNVKGFSGEILKDINRLSTLLSGVPVEPKTKTQLDKVLHENLPESLQFIQTSADAMNSLVVTLVEVARAGFAPVRPENLDMNELINKVLATIEIKIKKVDVAYSIETMPRCFADRTQVEQIFRNLLDNAVKYLDPDRQGQIVVGGRLEAGSALYWVADNGIGISVENQEKIFDPYYQLKEKATDGMGMGLATVKRMVDRNDGRIWVISEKGKGSTFYIALPKLKQ